MTQFPFVNFYPSTPHSPQHTGPVYFKCTPHSNSCRHYTHNYQYFVGVQGNSQTQFCHLRLYFWSHYKYTGLSILHTGQLLNISKVLLNYGYMKISVGLSSLFTNPKTRGIPSSACTLSLDAKGTHVSILL